MPSQSLIINSRVTLKGAGRNNTIIDANPDGTAISPVINIQSTSTEVLIDGIAIKNGGLAAPAGATFGVGLKSQAINLALKNCEISYNTISGTSASAVTGVGLYHKSTGLFTMDNCNIQNNTGNLTNAAGYSWGAGAYIEAAKTDISNSNISNNTFPIAQGASGGAGLTLLGNSSITKTTISNNQARNFAAGIYYSSAFEHDLSYSNLEQNATNSLSFGNHIYLSGTSKLNILNSALLDSTSPTEHIFASTSVVLTIKNSTLHSTVASELIELSSAIADIEASTLYSADGNTINFRLNSGTLYTKSSIYWTGNFTCTSHTNPVYQH